MTPLFLSGALAALAPQGRGATSAGRPGVLVDRPSATLLARVGFVVAVWGIACREDTALVAGRPVAARVCAAGTPGEDALLEQALDEILAGQGRQSVAAMRARLGMIRTRAASRLRARTLPAPASLRCDWGRDAVREQARHHPYLGFFNVEESHLSFRRFDGAMSAPVDRAGFVAGDAAIVLPYDPATDRVMLIEQFRMGPWLRGDPRPWVLEPIAGRIDAGETPADCARREAREEAGLELDELLAVSSHYPSPGAVTEFFHTFIGLARLDPAMQGIGGMTGEAEDIRSHVIAFDRLMELVSSGEANCGPLVLLALWLAANRSRLRGAA